MQNDEILFIVYDINYIDYRYDGNTNPFVKKSTNTVGLLTTLIRRYCSYLPNNFIFNQNWCTRRQIGDGFNYTRGIIDLRNYGELHMLWSAIFSANL